MADPLEINGGTSAGVNYTDLVVGIIQADKDEIINGVYNSISGHLDIIKGLVQSNFRFTNQIYDTHGNMVAGVIRLYHNSSDCTNEVNHFAEYIINGVYDTNNHLVDYRVVG